MNDIRKFQSIHMGDRITIQTIRGIKGNIIGRLPDGRTVLFERGSPYTSILDPDQLVECNVIHLSQRYVIVDPIREPKPFKSEKKTHSETKPIEVKESPDNDRKKLLDNLGNISKRGEWEFAIIARALRYLIGMMDTSISIDHSTQKTDIVAEEPPEDQTSDSNYLNELQEAPYSFESDQIKVKESKAPESKFLRYLEEEGRKENDILSITIENFGSVEDRPKNLRLLTMMQTRYLKEHHLKDLDGYDEIERFSKFFVESSALKRGEYGSLFYASTGTNPWNKVYKITVQRQLPPNELGGARARTE